MKRHIPAAVGLNDLDTELIQVLARSDEILLPLRLRAAAEGDDGWMLDEEETFLGAIQNLGVNFFLNRPRVAVAHCAQIDDLHILIIDGTLKRIAALSCQVMC
jgi:hypothetical protein